MSFDFKPKKLDAGIPFSIKKLDGETIKLVRPNKIAGRYVRKIPKKKSPYKSFLCKLCNLPTVWADIRVRHQWNQCQQCGAINEMAFNSYQHLKDSRIVEELPPHYKSRAAWVRREDG